MKNIRIVRPDKLDDDNTYTEAPGGWYFANGNMDDAYITLAFDSEPGEGQYPLEDLLEDVGVYVNEFLTDLPQEDKPPMEVVLEFAGPRDDIEQFAQIVGKRVYNKETEHGVELVIE